MEEQCGTDSIKLGDQYTSDIVVHLKNSNRRPQLFHSHSTILKSSSNYFAERLSDQISHPCIEIQCTDHNYDHHVKLLKSLYLPSDKLLDSWDSVRSALGVLQVAETLKCDTIIKSCIQYLEAVPWEDSEEDEVVRIVSRLGPIGMPVLERIQAADLSVTKCVFISAMRFATSVTGPCLPFGDELRTSAQEQVEYMLGDDGDTPLVANDNEVKMETMGGLCKAFSLFESELSSVLECGEDLGSKLMQCLVALEWVCNIMLKMGLMTEFVSKWIDASENILQTLDDKKLKDVIWDFKLKLLEVTSKVLDVVGYGNVIVPAPQRLKLLKLWLPYIRKLKLSLDEMNNKDADFPQKMDEDMCQNVQGAIVSLVLGLPSDDQAEILSDWMSSEQVTFPDLSEAFEIWCFRTKSAKRRLVGGLGRVDSPTVDASSSFRAYLLYRQSIAPGTGSP